MTQTINFVRRFYSKNTVYALSSGLGKCGVTVIRVTGPKAKDALKYVGGFRDLPEPRKVVLRSLRNVINGEIIDKGLVLWFPGPKSFTGEDSCEFQVHGSVAVIDGIMKSLSSIPSLCLAEPGEFTRRAFYNGKLDLTEVEGLADLLNAETEIQRKQAFLQSQGYLSKLYHQWKEELTHYQAHVEAMIDFEESENLGNRMQQVFQKVKELDNKLRKHISDGKKGEILKQGVQTVIVGQPNVGKSSLFNILCGRPAAIVTPISGTTRDIIEIKVDISGYPVILSDTAGLHENSDDPIENEGMKRAIDQVEAANLVVLMMVADDYYLWKKTNKSSTLNEYIKLHLEMLGLEKLYSDYKQNKKEIIPVINKIDLSLLKCDENVSCISCTTGSGIDNLINEISCQLKEICGEPTKEHLCMNNARHREHLKDCLEELCMFLKNSQALNSGEYVDLVILAEHLRRASKHLGSLVGRTYTDGILDVIFRDFCIGK